MVRVSKEIYEKLMNNSLDYKINKYHNKKTTYEGIKFDSIKEMNRYKELELMEDTDYIIGLELQKKFELQPSFIDNNGNKHRAITYIVDFYYYDTIEQCYIAEDVKGYKTQIYQLKKKMFMYKYPNIKFKEVI